MKAFCLFFTLCAHFSASLISCPTCIGLPRPNERPFFERKSFLAAVQPAMASPSKQQKMQTPSTQNQQAAPNKLMILGC